MILVWTVRLAVTCYLARLLLTKCRMVGRVPTRTEAILWAVGCTAYLAHVLAAFAFAHDWSHAAAWEFTAQETERMVGIRRGDGLWVNYLFSVIWIADTTRVATAAWRKRPTKPVFDVGIAGLFAFIMFSATVVFGQNLYRYLALPVGIALVIAWRSGSPSTLRDQP